MSEKSGKLSASERREADKDHKQREDMPGEAFLEPESRKYPVKSEKDGQWEYDRDLLLAAEREAEMHGHKELAERAKAIRVREFESASDAMTLAFDRSARSIDADGRMHVQVSNISKATVNPYYGREIPGWQSLGLDADRVYQLLRDPVELAKGAPTFNNLPLLSEHVPVSADDPQKDLIVGATGTDAEFVTPYLRNSLVIWDAQAIAGINTREQCELSCAYRYVPVMTPGAFEGAAYDGVMTQIVGNHVALVEVGRAGPDVVVSDADPFVSRKSTMKATRKTIAVRAALKAYLRPMLAADAALDINQLVGDVKAATLAEDAKRIAKAVSKVKFAADKAKDEDVEKVVRSAAEEAEDDEDEDEEERKKREAEEKKAKDEEEAKKNDADSEKAMDAAIAKARSEAEASAVQRMNAIRQAEKDVQPIVGEVAAMDSAEAVYKFALDHAGVDVSGVHPSAYASLVKMHVASKASKPAMAHDAAAVSDFWKQFGDSIQLPARS